MLADSTTNVLNNITHDSIVNIINNLYNRASAGYSILTIQLPGGELSDDEKAIATNKGWIISW